MAKKFSQLRNQMSPQARAEADALTEQVLAEMPLQKLRRARDLSQEQLAEILQVRQATISKLERRTDMYISTLRICIQAMGGDLEITARFPDGEIRIAQFSDLAEENENDGSTAFRFDPIEFIQQP